MSHSHRRLRLSKNERKMRRQLKRLRWKALRQHSRKFFLRGDEVPSETRVYIRRWTFLKSAFRWYTRFTFGKRFPADDFCWRR